jgi:hypothetical protein
MTQRLWPISAAGALLVAAACGDGVTEQPAATTTFAPAPCGPEEQDNDGDGVCAPTCAALGWTCGERGVCTDDSGTARCDCEGETVDDGEGACVLPDGSSCATALELTIGTGPIHGDTRGAGNDHGASCQEYTGHERVHRFELAEEVTLRFQVTGFDTVLYLRSDCEDPTSEIACSDDSQGSDGSSFDRRLEPGTYYLFVDGFGAAAGPYTLTVDGICDAGLVFDPTVARCVDDPCEPNPCTEPHRQVCEVDLPTGAACRCDPGYLPDPDDPTTCVAGGSGEGCSDPILLPVGDGVVTDSTIGATDHDVGSCGGAGADRVFTFTLTDSTRVALSMTGFDTVLYLRRACDDPSTEEICSDDHDGVYAGWVQQLPAGQYYLFADSWGDPGDFSLEYSFRTDPCAGDPCLGAPECAAQGDWSGYECVCPQGTLPHGATCVDDPCDPNLCAGGTSFRNRCQPDAAAGTYECSCNVGYQEDAQSPGGACLPDPTAKDWTVLVYLNADNNLESYGYQDLAEMAVAGSTGAVDIVVLLDTLSADGGAARKLYVTAGGHTELAHLGEIDMGNWRTLADFGAWAVVAFPARRYALVLWDHGDGWTATARGPLGSKGFSTDDHGSVAGISIANGDYGRALDAIMQARGDKLDLVGFDACLMGMWEVAAATAPFASRFVASEETIPLAGWSYDDFLVPLVGDPQMTPDELGVAIVDSYYAETTDNDTLALIDLDTMADLNAALSAFADALLAAPSTFAAVETARQAAQTFYSYDAHRDLVDVVTRISGLPGTQGAVSNAALDLLAQLGVTIVHSRAQTSHPDAHGLAIYFPARSGGLDATYTGSGAIWSQQTTWDDFLAAFTQ